MTREEAIAYHKKNAIRIKGIMAEEDEALKDRFSQTLEATEMAIQALEQEPKTGTGHWNLTYPYGKQNPIYECPRCHASNSSIFKNYCPNCGARMGSEYERDSD